MRRACAALALTCISFAQPPAPADQAAPRTDANSMLAHQQLLEKVKQGRTDVYFEGDSIVRRWGAVDYPDLLANWNRNFFGWNAADFGWGADRIENILWRLENGELDGIKPKVIVLLAGTNNVGNRPPAEGEEIKAAEITRGLEAMLKLMRAKAPDATIILMAIFPRNDNMAVMPLIDRVNENLARLADGRKTRFLSINDKLADKDGKLFDGMMNPDKLHPTSKAYQIWADALKPIFQELLGPPAQQDHAPPPTGDPGARK
ncbi:MAG TPA: GDSL-type esterase/lipase family protein [Bryobacteraceae bacterium]|nr:GDSL-type esterase/lipase family protein [Bryobacteraceae bacterium]